MPTLSQCTIQLMDDLDDGDLISVEYVNGDRERMRIGEFDGYHKLRVSGEWCVFLKHRYLGIPLIDVTHIERVKPAENA